VALVDEDNYTTKMRLLRITFKLLLRFVSSTNIIWEDVNEEEGLREEMMMEHTPENERSKVVLDSFPHVMNIMHGTSHVANNPKYFG